MQQIWSKSKQIDIFSVTILSKSFLFETFTNRDQLHLLSGNVRQTIGIRRVAAQSNIPNALVGLHQSD